MIEQWLNKFTNYERVTKNGQFSLDTIAFLAEEMDHPEKSFNAIHIAGSKGKGSVSSFIASILHEYNINEGLYTSPHISDFRERIRTSSKFFSEQVYENAAKKLITKIDSISQFLYPNGTMPSWFELTTLYSFLCFQEAHIEWGVFETGLGGRFDATNILQPAICAITHIELEHTEYLGNTLKSIAFEKAGIIKKNTPVCIFTPSCDEVQGEFRRKAHEMNAPLFFLDEYVQSIEKVQQAAELRSGTHKNTYNITMSDFFQSPLQVNLQMLGDIQAKNAALAALTICVLFSQNKSRYAIDKKKIEDGISKSFLNGRFEVCFTKQDIQKQNPIILDGAHTVSSISLALQTLFENYGSQAHLLFACAADKDIYAIAPLFFSPICRFTHITISIPGNIKKANIQAISASFNKEVLKKNSEHILECNENYSQAITSAIIKARQEGVPLLVIGSFYLVAEVKKIL